MNYYCDHNICPVNTKLPQGTDTLQVSRNVRMERIAELCNITGEELRALNPQYRTTLIPGEAHACTLRMPTAAINAFIEAGDSVYAPVQEVQTSFDVPVVEQPAKIARRNRTTVAHLRRLNGIRGNKVMAGQRIRVN